MSVRELFVVETEDDQYLGFVRLADDGVHISSGRAGRPRVVALEDLVRLTRASAHPDTESR